MPVDERSEDIADLIRYRGDHKNIAVQTGRIGTVRVVDEDLSGRGALMKGKTKMSFFIVTMTHPDGDSWNRHLAALLAQASASSHK
jgi:hypothetical protein